MLSLLLLLPALATSPASHATFAAPPVHQDTVATEVEELVRQGRERIAAGEGEEARILLAQADEADGGLLRTRRWLVRAYIEKGFLNDALDMTDVLSEAGNTGPSLDYLYGMAFVYKARKYISQGVNLGTVGMQFSDAVDLLQSATLAEPDLFADAYLPLAEAAWNSQRLEVARAGAEQAVTKTPGAAAQMMLGEVAFSQFIVANADEALADAAAAHWQVAFDAFQAVAATEDVAEQPNLWRMATALRKSGDALVWQGKLPEAGAEYARAMGASPAAVDYGQLHGSLGQEDFRKAIESGEAAFTQRYGEKDVNDATLLWWLGYARFTDKDFDPAREAFTRAFAKWPDAANSLWYIGICHYHTKHMDEAVDALVQLATTDEGALNGGVRSNLLINLRILDFLVGHCFQSGRLIDAGRLSAAQANASPEASRYWNNVGLFYRDAGDGMARAAAGDELDEVDEELRQRCYEKALEGYSRALELEPDNAQLLNDTAVVLHYNLNRDLPRARELYARSAEQAEVMLAKDSLSKQDREIFKVALRDSRNNLRRLDALLASREEAARKAREEAEREARKAREAEERKKKKEEEEEEEEEEAGGTPPPSDGPSGGGR